MWSVSSPSTSATARWDTSRTSWWLSRSRGASVEGMRWRHERSAFACGLVATLLGCGGSGSDAATGSTSGSAFSGASQAGASSTGPQSPPDASTASGLSSASSGGAVVTSAEGGVGGPTFYKDVDPILQNSCQRCHITGGIAPFPLVTY